MTAPDDSFVYVANADTQDLSVFALRSDGGLARIATVSVQEPPHPGRSMVLARSPDARFLYAGYFTPAGNARLASFAIDPASGTATLLGRTDLVDTIAYLEIDRTGRFLLSASYAGNKVAVNAIGADGVVGATRQVIVTPPKAHCILTDPSNRFVLHTSLGADLIQQQRFDPASGLLSQNLPAEVAVTAKSGPRFLRFSPDGLYVYVICELDGAIDVFPFDGSAGVLRPPVQRISGLPPGFAGTPWAADIHLTPNGEFLYVSERTSSTLSGFRTDWQTGRLAPIGTIETVQRPRGFAIDPTGQFLLAAGQLSNSLACYRIDAASGNLSFIAEHAVGKNPTWVEILWTGVHRPEYHPQPALRP